MQQINSPNGWTYYSPPFLPYISPLPGVWQQSSSLLSFFVQATSTSGATFVEESLPISVAETFNLTDLDSADSVAMRFPVTVTLMDAVDGDTYEGLLFDTTGTNVSVEVTTPTNQDDFTISYSLDGSDTYSAYQNVSACDCTTA